MGFDEAHKHTQQFEGGYCNVPGDSGGETFRGISRNNFPKWPGWMMLDDVKKSGKRLPREIDAAFKDHKEMAALVADFYKDEFWDRFK